MRPESNDSEEIRRFEEHYRRNPDSLAFARLADAHRKAGEPVRALDILEDGIRRHPDYPSAHIVRARALIDMGRPADAGAALHRVLELDSRNLVAMRELAGLAEQRGAPHEAVGWYEQIVALDPLNAESVQALDRLRSARTAAPEQPGLESLPATSEEWWSSVPAEAGPATGADAVEAVDGADAADGAPPSPDDAGDDASGGAAWWFEDPGDNEPSDDGDLLTRTMAELYVKQGLLGEAAAIYRELLSDRPDEEELRRVLADVERRMEAPPEGAVPAAPAEPGTTVAEPEPPSSDRYATHDVPATAGTSDVFHDWLRRLRE